LQASARPLTSLLALPGALPICVGRSRPAEGPAVRRRAAVVEALNDSDALLGRAVNPVGVHHAVRSRVGCLELEASQFGVAHELVDRKSTRLNSSHVARSYAVFC